MATTRKMTRKQLVEYERSGLNYSYFLLFFGAFVFFALINTDHNNLQYVDNQSEPIVLPEITTPTKPNSIDDDDTVQIKARCPPILDLDPEEFIVDTVKIATQPIKDIIPTNISATKYTNVAGLVLRSESALHRPILEQNSNRFLTNLPTNRLGYGNWVRSIQVVLGGDNIYHFQEYYSNMEGDYRLTYSQVYWLGGPVISNIININVYRVFGWVNQTAVYVV